MMTFTDNMKSILKLVDHSILPGQKLIEVWHNGIFIGTVAGTDGPGVRFLTTRQITATDITPDCFGLAQAIEITTESK